MDCEKMQVVIFEEPNLMEKKEGGRRGRKPGRKVSTEKIDIKAKLERSRQSARECRARKKLRYQYLEELVVDREKAVIALRTELDRYKQWSENLNDGCSEGFNQFLEDSGILKKEYSL